MTQTPKNPKIPLTKGSRSLFEKRFQELYLKEADAGTSDEALMKAVNDYEANNPNSATGQTQKTIQDEGENEAGEEKQRRELTFEEMELLPKVYEELFGNKIPEGMSMEDVVDAILEEQSNPSVGINQLTEDQKQEQAKQSWERYFDLFGSQPLPSMTMEQVLQLILMKEIELEKSGKPVVEEKPTIELKEGQVLAKNEDGEERVFEKRTLEYLPEWTPIVQAPKEIQKLK